MAPTPAEPTSGTDRLNRRNDPRLEEPTLLAGSGSDPRLDQPMVVTGSGVGSDSGTRATFGFGLNVAGLGSLVGTQWGDFQLGELLGRGGMGAVYRGRQASLDRAVAIKVLPPDLAERDELRERFLREARAIAQVASPHIVQVFHAGSHAGWYFYAMELIDGPDLGRRLRDGWRPGVIEARQLVLHAARGLAVAARWGIVHRDIKPANMLIAADGCLKLTDFGLVRRAGEQELTTHGQIMGTAAYLSPEQALGQPCDARSDLYALGVVLFELLTGAPPFVGDTPAAVIFQHLHAAPAELRERNPAVDPATAAICAKLLAKDPATRYQSATDLVRDLEAAANGRSLRFASAGTATGNGRRNLIIAVVLLAAAGTGLWLWQSHRATVRRAADEERRITTLASQAEARAAAARAAAAAATAAAAAAEAAHHDAFGRFSDLVVPNATFRLREIAPGSVHVGSPRTEDGRSRDEIEAEVRFTTRTWIGDSEVTQGQWRAVMGGLPEQAFPDDTLPVTSITRAEAESFCARLASLRPGLSARLPTEAEWERAAHAGSTGPWSGGRPLATQGWYAANSGKRPHPPRQFPANPWGIFDIHGNVAEWTADAYTDRTGATLTDPPPLSGSGKAVLKGGAWDDDPEDCRIAIRETARSASKRIGFRIFATALPADIR